MADSSFFGLRFQVWDDVSFTDRVCSRNAAFNSANTSLISDLSAVAALLQSLRIRSSIGQIVNTGVKLPWVRVSREYSGKRREKAVDPVRTVQSPLNVQIRDFLYVDATRGALSY